MTKKEKGQKEKQLPTKYYTENCIVQQEAIK
jgi:hypothetical protein